MAEERKIILGNPKAFASSSALFGAKSYDLPNGVVYMTPDGAASSKLGYVRTYVCRGRPPNMAMRSCPTTGGDDDSSILRMIDLLVIALLDKV